jgi:SAM-dependent methyltransferase
MENPTTAVEIPYCTEDLAELAATQYRLADRFCDTCRSYHSLWPYRRISRVIATAEADRTDVEPALAELFQTGRRKVLIAGAADSGLLALTARAGARHGVNITVLDRCLTPLELCGAFSRRWSLSADLLHQDLRTLDREAEFDLVFANSILLFIASEWRHEVLQRLRRALRPDGRLVHVFNVSGRIAGEISPGYRAGYSGWIIDELQRCGIPLPDSREAFTRRLDTYAREFETREGTFSALEDVVALHQRAGFVVLESFGTGMGLVSPMQHVASKLAKRRYIMLAVPQPLAGLG